MTTSAQPSDTRVAELLADLLFWQKNAGPAGWPWAEPALLSRNVQQRLQQVSATLPPEQQQIFQQALAAVQSLQATWELSTATLPLGTGPLEELQTQFAEAEINAARMLEITSQLTSAGAFSALYVKFLGQWAHERGRREDWRTAVSFSMMLRTAVNAAGPDNELAICATQLDLDWVEIASGALRVVPDGRLFADALAAGEALQKKAHQSANQNLEAKALHRLGTLHLDPYFANRSSETYQYDLAAWRGTQEPSWDRTPNTQNIPRPLPAPQEALQRAESYYRAAEKISTGESCARTLKALAYTLMWRGRLDNKNTSSEVAAIVERALGLIDWRKLPDLFGELLSYLIKTGVRRMPAGVDEILEETPESLMRMYGRGATLDIYFYLADFLTAVAPARALTLVKEMAPLFLPAGEAQRQRLWRLQIRTLIAASVPTEETDAAMLKAKPEGEKFVGPLAHIARQRSLDENWNERRAAAKLIQLSRLTTGQNNEEKLGVALLDEALQLAPLTLQPFRSAITFLRTILLVNCAANAFAIQDFADSAQSYSAALTSYIELSAFEAAGGTLPRLVDIAQQGGPTGAAAAFHALAPHAVTLQTMLGNAGMRGVREVCERAILALSTTDRATRSILTGLWQLAKGLQFGAFLTSGANQRLVLSDERRTMLTQMTELRAQAESEPQRASVLQGALQNELILLAPYERYSIQLPGATATDRLANLEFEYEELVDRELKALTEGEGSSIIAPEDLCAGIDPGMVLLDLLEVNDKTGVSTLLYALWTHEDVTFHAQVIGKHSAGRMIATSGVSIELTLLSEKIQAMRQSVMERPGEDGELSAAGRDDLQFLGKFFLDPIWETLEELRNKKGKRHLCIAPHGALHYLPFHLLLISGKPLAACWSVTYMPNTRILLANRGGQGVRRFRTPGPASVGLSFEDTDQPLLEAVSEAREIAKAGAGSDLLNEEATEPAVQNVLRQARMVHIATHGALPSGSAAFQLILLAPGGGEDGVLYAHELVGRDLRGLSLVTLSACETALGRFDIGDNLRGFTANLLLAGAEAVVGTLWPVETLASSTFFRALYRELAKHASRLQAFETAQAETRAKHPQFRDWGAFYYTGNWS